MVKNEQYKSMHIAAVIMLGHIVDKITPSMWVEIDELLSENTMGNINRKSFLQKALSREDYCQFLKDEFAHVLPSDIPLTTSNIVEHMQDVQIQAINRLFNRLKRERFQQFEKSMIK